MRKFFCIALTMTLMLGLFGCSNDGNSSSKETIEEKNNKIDENGMISVYKIDYEAETATSGLSDKAGNIVVDVAYAQLYHCIDDIYAYSKDGEVGLMDHKGNVKGKQKGDFIVYLGDVESSTTFITYSDHEVTLLDEDFSEITKIEGKYQGRANTGNYLYVERDGKYGVVDLQGKEVLPFEYTDIRYVTKSPATSIVCKNQNCSLLDQNLNEIITGIMPVETVNYYGYDQIIYMTEYDKTTDSYLVFKDGNMMVISADGKKQTKAVKADKATYGQQGNIRRDEEQFVVYDEDSNKTTYYDKNFTELLIIDGRGYAFHEGIATVSGKNQSSDENKIINEKGEVIASSNDQYTNLYNSEGYITATNITGEKIYILDQEMNAVFESSMEASVDDLRVISFQGKKYFVEEKTKQGEDNAYYTEKSILHDEQGNRIAELKGRISSNMNENNQYITTWYALDNTNYLYKNDGTLVLDGSIMDQNYDDVIVVTDDAQDVGILYDKETLKEVCRTPKGYRY